MATPNQHQDAFQAALAQARASAQKFRDEGKLPPEDITTQGTDFSHFIFNPAAPCGIAILFYKNNIFKIFY